MAHYSIAQKPDLLFSWAEKIATEIYAKIKNKEITHPILVYTGMSGVGTATGLSLALHMKNIEHGMMYIRKENEKSHGDRVEFERCLNDNGMVKGEIIFVDDFISSGNTRKHCLNSIYVYTRKTKFDYLSLSGSEGEIDELELDGEEEIVVETAQPLLSGI